MVCTAAAFFLVLMSTAAALEVIVAGRSVKSIVSSPNTGLDVNDIAELWRDPTAGPKDPFLEAWERKVRMSEHNSRVRLNYSEPDMPPQARALASSIAEARLRSRVELAATQQDLGASVFAKTLEIAELSAALTRVKLEGDEAPRLEEALEAVRSQRRALEDRREAARRANALGDARLSELQAQVANVGEDPAILEALRRNLEDILAATAAS